MKILLLVLLFWYATPSWALSPPPVMEDAHTYLEVLPNQSALGNDGQGHYWVDGVLLIRCKYNNVEGFINAQKALDEAHWQIRDIQYCSGPGRGMATVKYRHWTAQPGME